jgi:hypothetical protein
LQTLQGYTFPADNFSKNKTKVIPNKECKILTHLHTFCKKNCIFRIKSDSSSAVFCKVLDISLNNDKICREISEDKISNLSENFGSTKREIFGFELSMFESERHAKHFSKHFSRSQQTAYIGLEQYYNKGFIVYLLCTLLFLIIFRLFTCKNTTCWIERNVFAIFRFIFFSTVRVLSDIKFILFYFFFNTFNCNNRKSKFRFLVRG